MLDALNMARHQASMSQPGKIVYVTEYPSDMNDRVPVRQMIHDLEKTHHIPGHHNDDKARLALIWQIDADVPDKLMGDTMRLTQIMLNLCSNAVKVELLWSKLFFSSIFSKITRLRFSLQKTAVFASG